MRRTALFILICCIFSTMLTACHDANETDDFAHVLAVGIDKGVSNKWRITVQFATLKNDGGSKMQATGENETFEIQEQDGYTSITLDAPSFYGGISMINSILPRKLNFMHTKLLVLSEDIARSGLIGEYLAPIARYREIRRNVRVLISKCQAYEFINENKPFFGKTLSKSMEQILNEWSNMGFFPNITLGDFYDDIKSTYHQPIAILACVNDYSSFKETGNQWGEEFKPEGDYFAGQIPRIGGNKIELYGTAVFDGDIMVGELNGDETRLMLMARDQFQRGFFTIPDPNNPELIVPLDVRAARKRKVMVKLEGDKPVIVLKIRLEGDLLAVQSGINYESKEMKPVLEKAFEQYIKNGLDKLIEKCQRLNADVFLFGGIAARHFATIEEWERYNWIAKFEKAEINTEVDFTIHRTGTILKSSSVIKTKGKE
ncbi:Ger(x)C family spore germination protein [Acetivibrio clariflavus]|uniref:Ger(x)C family spore germination protein n=1 Tax=Acetivibrio clariflavus TaxID=288965 RepID=UPI000489DCEF|nr:Ger(x)C family spore germination protein [Acetivibrio clariflavus]